MKREITLNLHSVIDVITNSSTEIFVNTHSQTETIIREFVELILKQAGSTKKFEELFVLEAVHRDYATDIEESSLKLKFIGQDNDVDLIGFVFKAFDIDGEYNG